LENENQKLKNDLNVTKEKVNSLLKSVENQKIDITNVNRLVGEKNRLINQHDTSNKNFVKEIEKLKLKNSSLNHNLDAINKELTSVKASVPEKLLIAKQPLEQEIMSLRDQLSELDKNKLENKQLISSLQNEFKLKINEVESISKEKETIEDALKRLMDDYRETEASIPEMVRREKILFQEQLADVQDNLESVKSALIIKTNKISRISDQLESLNSKIKNIESEKTKLMSEKQKLSNELTEIKNLLPKKVLSAEKPLKVRIKTLEENLNLMDKSIAQSKADRKSVDQIYSKKLAEFEKAIKEKQSLQEALSALNEKFIQSRIELNAKLKTLENQNIRLKNIQSKSLRGFSDLEGEIDSALKILQDAY